MVSQKATRGQSQVTSTACAITNRVMKSEDHASTLFLENRLVKNPAGQIIGTKGAMKNIWSMNVCQVWPLSALENEPERIFWA